MRMRGTAILPALSLYVGRQLVWLAEKTSASAMLGSLALVVSHGVRLVSAPIGLPRSSMMEQPAHVEDSSWRTTLGKGECEAAEEEEEEVAALEAEHGPFKPADGEG